jgi:hypothetical protein
MASTYTNTDLDGHLNWIRLRIGDTDVTNDPQLTDEEIAGVLAREPRREQAAALCAELVAAKYARYGAAKEAENFASVAMMIRREIVPDYL